MFALSKRASVLLFPVCGLLFLGGSVMRPYAASQPALAVLSTTPDDIPQVAPAAFNSSRRAILRKQLQFYRGCRQRLEAARTEPQRAEWRETVRRAVASYNQAVADTDASAFDHTNLPQRL